MPRQLSEAHTRSAFSGRLSGGKRRTLLVMATGTGKTRTTMALIDLFLRANQALDMFRVLQK